MVPAIDRHFFRHNPVAVAVAVNVAVYVLDLIVSLFSGVSIAGQLLSMPSCPVELLHRPWTVLTYMFAQYDFMHLIVNMLWLWCFGRFLQDVISARRFACLYIAGGLSGALVFIGACAVIPSLSGVSHRLVGSSASVIAVVAATAILLPSIEVRFLMLGSVRLSVIAWITVALDLTGLFSSHPGAHYAHLGGLISGVVFALALRRPHSARSDRNRQLENDFVSVSDDRRRLDDLLDKVRRSGFASLSMDERRQLMRLSDRERRRQ